MKRYRDRIPRRIAKVVNIAYLTTAILWGLATVGFTAKRENLKEEYNANKILIKQSGSLKDKKLEKIRSGQAYLYQKNGIEYKSIWLFGVFSYFTTIVVVLRVKYLHGEFNSFFLWSSIIVSLIIFVPCLIYGIKYFKLYRDWEKLIGLPLAVLIGGFLLTWLTVASMNVYLDISVPTYEEYVIIDKDIKSGSRQVTTYEFDVKKDDTVFTIGVSEAAYYNHDVNDTIKLSIYKGAFNEPYYIHEESKN